VTFAHPAAALAALAGMIPLALMLLRGRAAARLRAALELAAPPLRARLVRPVALACVFVLLGLAAAQPSIRRQHERAVRGDAQLLVVLDSSRSMLAAEPGGTPRYRRAVAFAHRLRLALPQVATGVASLSNRLLPYLFPTVDGRAYDAVLDRAYGIQRPHPAVDLDRRVTTFDALRQAAGHAFFSPRTRRRVVVVLSDAETQPFDAAGVLGQLRRRGATPVVVRFWRPDERILRPDGTPEDYRAAQPDELRRLRAAGWRAYPERSFAAVVGGIEQTLGPGAVRRTGYLEQRTSIAPVLALAALLPLLLVLLPAGRLPRLRPRARGALGRGRALLDR
jgi:hypothetical protein